jgi:hypothetical protein
MGGASGLCDLAFFCHVPVGIDLREALPLFWKVFDGEDCRYRADWDAGTAVNAFFGIDVKLTCSRKLSFVFTWVNTVTRADVHARCILCAHTRFGNYVCHSTLLDVTEREARLILYSRERGRFSVEKAMPPQERRIELCGKYGDDFSHGHREKTRARSGI